MKTLSKSLLTGLCVLLPVSALADCPRIVSQSPYLTEALEWLGRGDCIVGVSRYDRRDLPRTGGVLDPDAAAIAALKPDLIVSSDWADDEKMRAVTPPGVKLVRLGGFGSIEDTEAMLLALAGASDVADGETRVIAFREEMQRRAAQVHGNGKRALVLSACGGGAPYSFGRNHFVGEVFGLAGFDVVDAAAGVRHLRPGEEITGIAAAVEHFKPEVVFALTDESAKQCNAEISALPVRVIALERDHFFHPGPGILQGLDELAEKMRS